MSGNSGNIIHLRTLKLPKQLGEHVLTRSLAKPFKTYLWLKINSSGKLKLSNRDKLDICRDLGYKSIKTVNAHLEKLQALNWVGYNPSSGYYFIRGFWQISRALQFESKECVEFDTRDVDTLKGFLAATCIAKLINKQYNDNRKRNKQSRSAESHTTGGSNQVVKDQSAFPVSNIGLAKCLGVAKSTAFRLKKLASNGGYIKVQADYEKTGLDAYHLNNYRMSMPELACRMRVVRGKIVLMKADLVTHSMRFRVNKKYKLA